MKVRRSSRKILAACLAVIQDTSVWTERKVVDLLTSWLDVMQGAGEQRTEVYGKYSKGAVQSATQQYASSNNRVIGFAGQQVVAPRGQEGLASIVIVGVLVILLALITLGFSRIMDRAVNNSLNKQLSAAASYAAQSGINDAMAYIKGQTNPDDVSTTDCTTLLKEPGMSNLVDLSGDGNTKVTCLLVNPTPSDLMYQELAPNGTQVIKATTSDSVDKFMFSWQASNGTNKTLPGTTSFSDVPTWDSAGNVPVLRVSLYPVPSSGKISGIQASSKTFFLVPGNGGGLVTNIPYTTTDGSVEQVNCNTKNTGINGLSADYDCNAIISGLYDNIAPGSYYYLTVTPIYNQTDVKIKAVNSQGQSVQFIDVQTVIDSTAVANNAVKRLQERVDSNTSGDNISYTENAMPYYSIRSAEALCKQLELHKSYYDYILNKAPGSCDGTTGVPTVPPTLALSIVGSDGKDTGLRVCSTGVNGTDNVEQKLWGCATGNNPDSPQSPVEQGTVYINSGTTIYWQSADAATYCDASGGMSGWPGDKNPSSSWSGVTGSGNQSFGGITNVTNFSMQCKGPGGTTATKTVTAWPPPRVSMSGTGSYHAGDSYNVSWSAVNASKCIISSSGNESWNQTYTGLNPGSASDSRWFNTSWDDHSSKSYSITCWDPIGRSSSSSWSVGTSGSSTTTLPPACTATAYFTGSTTSDAVIHWNDGCSNVPTNLYNVWIDTDIKNIGAGLNNVDGASGGNVPVNVPGTHHFQVYIWAPGWKSQAEAASYGGTTGDGEANSGYKTITLVPPTVSVRLNSYDGRYLNPGDSYCGDRRSESGHQWVLCPNWTWSDPPNDDVQCQVIWRGSYNTDYTSPPQYERYAFAGIHSGLSTSYDTFALGFSTNAAPTGYVQIQCWDNSYGGQYATQTTGTSSKGPVTCATYSGAQFACGIPPPPQNNNPVGGPSGGGNNQGGGGGNPAPQPCPPGWTGPGQPNCTPISTGCFIAGTMIATLNGSKPIEDIRVGDWVESWDTKAGRMVSAQVTHTFIHPSQPTLWIVTSGGSVTTTSIHPFWTGNKWVEAGNLVPGKSYIYDIHGKAEKVLFMATGANRVVYNLEIGNSNHDFFANGFLVHNKLTL